VPPVPNATEEPSVPVNVSVLLAVSVFPSAMVNVEPVAGAVSATLLIVVADATPREGVIRLGDVPKTKAPVPVSSVTAVIRFELDGVPRKVAMPVPSPLTPVEIGSPVPFVNVTLDGVPNTGVTSVGDVEKTRFVLVVPVVPVAAERYPTCVSEVELVVSAPPAVDTATLLGVRPVISEPVMVPPGTPLIAIFQSVSAEAQTNITASRL